MAKKAKHYYQVYYRDPKDGQIVSIKVRTIEDSSLGLSFVKLADFVFSESALVVSPSEEQLKKRLENVKSLHLSIYSIISIEELGLEHQGLKFEKDRSNLVSFPKGPEIERS